MKIVIARLPEELERLREPWERLFRSEPYTRFQSFEWNLLAAQVFAPRQAPAVVYAERSSGSAIIPAAIAGSGDIFLLGEELFDYRTVLHQGDPAALHAAFAAVSSLGKSLKIVALRDEEQSLEESFPGAIAIPFSGAPALTTSHKDSALHSRLGRCLRRLLNQSCLLKQYPGSATALIRRIYELKGAQGGNLFHDRLRIDFLCQLAHQESDVFDIYTLEHEGDIVSALVTFRDGKWRRFYTTYFDERWAKYSPGLALLHHVALQSLEAGLNCDFMTGDQPYKMRLATTCVPLYTLELSQAQMREMDSAVASVA